MSVSQSWLGAAGLNLPRLDARIMSFLPFLGSFQPIFLYIRCIFLRFVGTPVSLATCAAIRRVPYVGRLEAMPLTLSATLASIATSLGFLA